MRTIPLSRTLTTALLIGAFALVLVLINPFLQRGFSQLLSKTTKPIDSDHSINDLALTREDSIRKRKSLEVTNRKAIRERAERKWQDNWLAYENGLSIDALSDTRLRDLLDLREMYAVDRSKYRLGLIEEEKWANDASMTERQERNGILRNVSEACKKIGVCEVLLNDSLRGTVSEHQQDQLRKAIAKFLIEEGKDPSIALSKEADHSALTNYMKDLKDGLKVIASSPNHPQSILGEEANDRRVHATIFQVLDAEAFSLASEQTRAAKIEANKTEKILFRYDIY